MPCPMVPAPTTAIFVISIMRDSSVAREARRALLEERRDAFAGILGREAGELRLGLEVERVRQRASGARVDAALDGANRGGRTRREQVDEARRLDREIVVRDDAVYEADAQRFGR